MSDEIALTPRLPSVSTRKGPLLPEAGAAGAPLTMVIAVICFLASLALTGFFAVNNAANAWTSDLRGSVTVQITGQTTEEITVATEAALAFLRGSEGVVAATRLTDSETREMLQAYRLPDGLPVPSIIALTVSKPLQRDISPLATSLGAAVPTAMIDDHAAWYDSLAASARTLKLLSLGIFILIISTVCTVIIFATRAGLAANREIVDVLHLVGATDMFIAKEVQRRFVLLGLRGALIGVAGAVLVVGGAVLVLRAADRTDHFMPAIPIDASMFIWVLLVPILTCLVSAWSARVTVVRTLKERF